MLTLRITRKMISLAFRVASSHAMSTPSEIETGRESGSRHPQSNHSVLSLRMSVDPTSADMLALNLSKGVCE